MSENITTQDNNTQSPNYKSPKKNENSSLKQAQASFERGNKLRKEGHLQKAINNYNKALRLNPRFAKPLIQLGDIYKTKENWEDETKCYRRAIGINPKNHGFYVRLARSLEKQNKIYGAIAAFAEAIELEPNVSPQVYKEYADLLLKNNNANKDAITAYSQAASMQDNWDVSFYHQFANLLFQAKEFNPAIVNYQKAISLEPNNAEFYFLLGNVYLRQNQITQAVKNYQKAIELDPNHAVTYRKLGDVLQQNNRLDDAAKCYQKTLEIRPDLKIVYRSLGDIFIAQGKQQAAQKCFQRVS